MHLANRNPENFRNDAFGYNKSARFPGRIHQVATSGLYSSVQFIVDPRDNLRKIRINNIDTVARCLHLTPSAGQSHAKTLAGKINQFGTVDEISGEKIYIDVEVCGEMEKHPGSRHIKYSSNTYLLLTHEALTPGANPHVLKAIHKSQPPKVRFTCQFVDVPLSRTVNLCKINEVHPSVRARMENL
jgi:hypothetical protein